LLYALVEDAPFGTKIEGENGVGSMFVGSVTTIVSPDRIKEKGVSKVNRPLSFPK